MKTLFRVEVSRAQKDIKEIQIIILLIISTKLLTDTPVKISDGEEICKISH